MKSMFFEDFAAGDEFVSAGISLTESMIVDFALVYDPQRFHLDREAAEKSPYHGLIASGFQTLALGFRMFLQLGLVAESSLGSPGIDELRWKLPVRPGDTLRTKAIVRDVRASKSKPDRGSATMEFSVLNQRDEEVLTFKTLVLLARRLV